VHHSKTFANAKKRFMYQEAILRYRFLPLCTQVDELSTFDVVDYLAA